jgi:hypothetical protein
MMVLRRKVPDPSTIGAAGHGVVHGGPDWWKNMP